MKERLHDAPPPGESARKAALKAGFTLIEMSMVLVIIGLVVGGILVGVEPRPLIFACCLTHTKQVAQLADPALSPGRGRLPDVLLGRLPSLHALRQRFPAVVRTLRR